jgi:hypothetical protein
MREMRAITFGDAETIKAVVTQMQKAREKLPSGQVTLDLIIDEVPVVRLIFTDDHGQRTILERDSADVANALVTYCLDRRIRLPANASKFIDIVDGQVALLIYMDERDALRALMRRPRTRRAAGARG